MLAAERKPLRAAPTAKFRAPTHHSAAPLILTTTPGFDARLLTVDGVSAHPSYITRDEYDLSADSVSVPCVFVDERHSSRASVPPLPDIVVTFIGTELRSVPLGEYSSM